MTARQSDTRGGGATGRRAPSPEPSRCAWARTPLSIRYHDQEWGVPVRADRRLFEMLVLEGAQAGLSWETILRKREAYRRAFAGFDPARVAAYDGRMIRHLLADPGIVRNRLKIESAVANAGAFRAVQAEWGRFATYIWRFVDGRPLINTWRSPGSVPTQTPESEAMSRDLARRGFRFVGPTICYAFMQAVGLVNDHIVGCFRHVELAGPAAGDVSPTGPSRRAYNRASPVPRRA